MSAEGSFFNALNIVLVRDRPSMGLFAINPSRKDVIGVLVLVAGIGLIGWEGGIGADGIGGVDFLRSGNAGCRAGCNRRRAII